MTWIFITLIVLLVIESFITIKLIRREIQKVCIPFKADFSTTNLITIQCTSSGINLCFIVDTGCAKTQIKQETLNKLNYKKCRKKSIAQGVIGEPYTTILRSIDIVIDGHTYETFCYTSKEQFNFSDGIDGLLGSDFFDKYGWIIDYKHKCIVIK